MADLHMIVGLGNPGPAYASTRHNIGFQCLELLARRHAIPVAKLQHKALTGQGWIARGERRAKVILVKPLTFMNLSGQAVAPLLRFYQVDPAHLLVIHDDLDLESGKLRLRAAGSSGGQNGVKSIIDALGTQEFARARIGIGRPPGRMDPAAWVLRPFSPEEEESIGPLRATVCDAAESWLFDGLTAAMNRYSG